MLNGTNSFYLKQTSDLITLVDDNAAIVDSVAWDVSAENISMIPSGSSHAGYTTMSPSGIAGWVEPAWATPGEINPEWPQYIGSNDVIVTEYMGWCDDTSGTLNDWIEVFNNGSSAIDLLRWRIDTATNRHFIIETGEMDNLNSANIISNSSKSTVVGPGEYALISLPYQFLWATDLPEIYNPDGLLISESSVHGEGLTTVTCQSWISDNGVDWSVAAYPLSLIHI